MMELHFENIASLDSCAAQAWLQKLTDEDLAYALKGSSPAARQATFSHLSVERGDSIKQIMEATGAVPLSTVEAAHEKAVDTFRQLTDDGEIIFA